VGSTSYAAQNRGQKGPLSADTVENSKFSH
jgi:hypothetical protein